MPAISVYGPSGALLQSTWGYDVASIELTAESAGTYTVAVIDGSAGLAASGPYDLHFAREPGADELGALTSGGTKSDTIDRGDLDTYTFAANAGDSVQLRVVDRTAGSLVPVLGVYGPDGAQLKSSWGYDVASIELALSVSGSYTVVVSDGASGFAGSGPYDLYFAREPGANELGALVSGTVRSDTIDRGDLDTFTFVANAGDTVLLRAADTTAGSLVPVISVYGPNGAQLNSTWGYDVAALELSLQVSGTHTVVVSDGASGLAGSGPYQLYFAHQPGPSELGSPVSGGSASETIDKGDIDSYALSVTQGQSLELRVTDVAAGALVPVVSVYGPSGAALTSAWGYDTASLTLTAATTGTYTVLVFDGSSGRAASGSYQLTYTAR